MLFYSVFTCSYIIVDLIESSMPDRGVDFAFCAMLTDGLTSDLDAKSLSEVDPHHWPAATRRCSGGTHLVPHDVKAWYSLSLARSKSPEPTITTPGDREIGADINRLPAQGTEYPMLISLPGSNQAW
jgi:hypothetical protein